MQVAFCAGGAYGGYKLGQKLAELEATKLKLAAAEAEKHRKAFEIGMALALCGGGALVANTIYSGLSKRDMEARKREMDAALADASPEARSYVLPESMLAGTMTAQPIEVDDGRECRTVVDNLAEVGKNEPAMARFCRKPPDGKYEVDI